MADEVRGVGGEKPDPEDRVDETVPINWACTVCGYRVEGALPEKCPECGADQEDFDNVPIPGF